MIDYKVVGIFISELRKSKGLTQKELAEELNLSHQAISKWENGLTLPDTETLLIISKKFNVKIDDILAGRVQENLQKNEHNEIVFECGIGVVPYLSLKSEDKFLNRVCNMRHIFKETTCKDIPLVRIMDKGELKDLQYRISINGKMLIDNNLQIVPEENRVDEMLGFLEHVIKINIDLF